ncbi:hypothetical protein Sme01_21250 [Sphaerisporangium melleum]|uniref:DUF624 domain-containing protein n=1 Tax=Sphaerisporangium melleum TaxID=321316 RepID=A0A917RMH1_9ACTN|nr:DUF624 domain-containing protein [Sphaerisporangium melleum]GGL15725.1 hypothetical protein GCM10007964_67150 [Sphaerisporangium melleum]GII69649.1 hypothetical protein Sme01_21250 [Sphaerisporangium melleum]
MTDPTGMTGTAAAPRFGRGPLSRASAFVYTLLVVELLLLAATLPGLAGLVLLDRHAASAPLAVACLLPVGPALAAALYALHHRSLDLTELHPAAAFWRGYRTGLRGVVKLWVPYLGWMAVLAANLANFAVAGVPDWWAVLSVLIGVAATLWVANALVITSLFTFRARDVARLAAYFLTRSPRAALGNAGLLVVAAGVTLVASEAALAVLASAFASWVLLNSRPLIAEVRRDFTA